MGRSKASKRIHIGTSGWHYAHWKGPYYPEGLSSKNFLEHYVEDFQTVEINNTFYKLPEVKTIKTWYENVPNGFLFSVKASRYITHIKRLKDPKSSLKNFFSRIKYLKEKLGEILFQLPPKWPLNIERFETFIKSLPKGYKYAFEFRDPTWLCDEIYGLLEKYNLALCIYEIEGQHAPKLITANHIYVRLHGPKRAYQGSYSSKALEKWAKEFAKWKKKEIFCYFDNDEKGYAPKNALSLIGKIL